PQHDEYAIKQNSDQDPLNYVSVPLLNYEIVHTELAWADRSAPGSAANVFTVIDQAGQPSTIDLSQSPDPPAGPTFHYRSTVEVTLEVAAESEADAFAMLDEVFIEVTAGGQPVRRGLVALITRIPTDPRLLAHAPANSQGPDVSKAG
ncbi:hypothetical protein AB0M95_39995, partial [Sphaerisporangium sp. NPDC051017]|uniref:hypothetical protein n=1 Tax=Sphaerisporangium sp. NPDC051017 TaxID=3154636 RepID=UPI003412B9C8